VPERLILQCIGKLNHDFKPFRHPLKQGPQVGSRFRARVTPFAVRKIANRKQLRLKLCSGALGWASTSSPKFLPGSFNRGEHPRKRREHEVEQFIA
jgi:hypothetical protein